MKWSVVSPLRIVLLDDHALIREGLKVRLSAESDLKVVGVYSGSAGLLEALRTEPADLLILDYQLSDGELDGLRLIQLLRSHYPELRILIFSSVERPATVNMAIRAGANGFFGKSQETEELVFAVRTVALDRLYLSPSMAAELDSTPKMPTPALSGEQEVDVDGRDPLIDYPALSPKEREVLRCCLGGMSVSQIAVKFLRSRKTISGQKQAALRKLNVRTDTELFKLHLDLKDI
ncbi:capsula synthesis response regulator transcription regulator protein [Pseudomonas sp. R4-34-07]|uniref:response regulator transcription factor n=1 Tax=Pseudomonas sp. R4-34-07 TaxID=658642 RepID=UPI000F561DD5|nr:response regulator transcription factor [Pseudomonas sp. R4-34-07]AZF55009.1 capsula synthesis response regulator transcription regulator protein [Pseudomonas sp. R4-34-07]